MQKAYIRWIIAIFITLTAAVYQRLTGPTHPIRGYVNIDNSEVSFKFERSHGGEGDQLVGIVFNDTSYTFSLLYKRYKMKEEWNSIKMQKSNDSLVAFLPHQPPAGKLEYYIEASKAGKKWKIPDDRSVVTRFKGAVPSYILIPHILFMFLAMLISTLAALEAIAKSDNTLRYTILASLFLFIGGMILGPIVQKFAFGDYWTGVPFGWDLTDNKTLVAMIGWIIALIMMIKNRTGSIARYSVIGAAVILLAMYSIPHSAMGSEFDYEKNKVVTGNTD